MCIFELQVPLYAARVSAEQLDALSKYVRRYEGDYLAVTQADGQFLLIASRAFPGSRLVTALEAAELLATALQNLDAAKKKPISTSRAWALHDRHAQADYVRRGAAPKGRFNLVVNRLRRAQLGPSIQPTDQGARADWLFPGSWPEEQMEWFYDGLASPPGAGEEKEEEG
jgi:hypothetical protein